MRGEAGVAMLREALRIKSDLWRGPGLSYQARLQGLIQILVEVGLRAFPDLDGKAFGDEVVAAWRSAFHVDLEAFFKSEIEVNPAYRLFAHQLISEATSLSPDRAKHLGTSFNGLFARCLAYSA
jgi:hypothetical protein